MTGQDFDALFARLSRSAFRARFRLGAKETSYLAANPAARTAASCAGRILIRRCDDVR